MDKLTIFDTHCHLADKKYQGQSKSAEEIIREAVDEFSYPVGFNFPAGHIDNNFAIYLGKKAKLEVSPREVKFKYLN